MKMAWKASNARDAQLPRQRYTDCEKHPFLAAGSDEPPLLFLKIDEIQEAIILFTLRRFRAGERDHVTRSIATDLIAPQGYQGLNGELAFSFRRTVPFRNWRGPGIYGFPRERNATYHPAPPGDDTRCCTSLKRFEITVCLFDRKVTRNV